MSAEEKAATCLAALGGEGAAEETAAVSRARQRLSIMSVQEQQHVLVEILEAGRLPSESIRPRSPAAETGQAPRTADHAALKEPRACEQRLSVRSLRSSSLVLRDVEDELEPLVAAAAAAARASWKRCRLRVTAAMFWRRYSNAHALARWKKTLDAEQLSRLERLYALGVLCALDCLARHARYFAVVHKAALEVEDRQREVVDAGHEGRLVARGGSRPATRGRLPMLRSRPRDAAPPPSSKPAAPAKKRRVSLPRLARGRCHVAPGPQA